MLKCKAARPPHRVYYAGKSGTESHSSGLMLERILPQFGRQWPNCAAWISKAMHEWCSSVECIRTRLW